MSRFGCSLHYRAVRCAAGFGPDRVPDDLPPARPAGDRNLTPMKTRLILTACASALLLGLPAAAPTTAWAESAAPAITAAAQGGV